MSTEIEASQQKPDTVKAVDLEITEAALEQEKAKVGEKKKVAKKPKASEQVQLITVI